MQEPLYKLIFEGKIQAGRTEERVKRQLQALLKADDDQIDRLFSGDPVIIRKNIPESSARQYESVLLKAGASCRILSVTGELELPPQEPAVTTTFTAHESLTASPEEKPVKKSSLFHGSYRLGRTRFLAWCWLVGWLEILAWLLPDYLSLIPGLLLTVQQAVMTAVGLHALAGIAFIAIIGLRLHDIDRSAWLWVFMSIPGLNLLFMIWLTFSRGSQGKNQYGDPPALPGNAARLFGFWIPLLGMISMAGSAWFYQETLMELVSLFPHRAVELTGF